jgi:hypothetical protein
MFAGKVRSLHKSGAPEKSFNQAGSGVTRKHLTRLERSARANTLEYFGKLINYSCKKFYNIGTLFPGRRTSSAPRELASEKLGRSL